MVVVIETNVFIQNLSVFSRMNCSSFISLIITLMCCMHVNHEVGVTDFPKHSLSLIFKIKEKVTAKYNSIKFANTLLI